MTNKTLPLVLLFFVVVGESAFADSNPEALLKEWDRDQFHFGVKGKAVALDRSRNFQIANTGNWGNIVLRGVDGEEDPLNFRNEGWGGGYGVEALFPNSEGIRWEATFEQSFLSKEETKSSLPGRGAGLLTAMAFIDGQPHGTPLTFGFFVSANPIAGQESPADATLKYDLIYHILSLDGVYRLLDTQQWGLDLFGGPAYASFLQDYQFVTMGTNSSTGGQATSKTDEGLSDHLFGGHLGVRGRAPLRKKFSLSFRQAFGFFARASRFEGAQDMLNVAGNAGGGVIFASLTERITVRKRDTGFVPRFASSISLNYDATRWMSVRLFYEFEAWLHLSRIQNGIITAHLRRLLNEPTTLEEEDVRFQMIGGELTLRF